MMTNAAKQREETYTLHVRAMIWEERLRCTCEACVVTYVPMLPGIMKAALRVRGGRAYPDECPSCGDTSESILRPYKRWASKIEEVH